jgi:hypothetical protein
MLMDAPADAVAAARDAAEIPVQQHLRLERRMLFGIELTLFAIVLMLGGGGVLGILVGVVGLFVALLGF